MKCIAKNIATVAKSSLFGFIACVFTYAPSYAIEAVAAPIAELPRAQSANVRADPLLSVDMNRTEIVSRIMKQWQGEVSVAERENFKTELVGLRADRLLAVSLVGTFDGVIGVLDGQLESNKVLATLKPRNGGSGSIAMGLGDPNSNLLYTPLTPCRLFDTRTGQSSALGQVGGIFLPNTQRSIVPTGACAIPATGVKNLFVGFTTVNNTPNSGGFLSLLAPAAPLTTSVDIFNIGAILSAGNATVPTGAAGEFDVFVATANAHVVVDVLGYFAPPSTTGTGLRLIPSTNVVDRPSVINGSASNTATGVGITVAGGSSNTGSGDYGTVGGGRNNIAPSIYSTVAGGSSNNVGGDFSTIGGGLGNVTATFEATVSGGNTNKALGGASTVGGGYVNTASAAFSTVPGGAGNVAGGSYSFAAGRQAKANYQGAFMWADSTALDFKVQASEFTGTGSGWFDASNSFNARATGGVWFVTAVDSTTGRPTTGAFLSAGSGTWSSTSDRNAKLDFASVNVKEVLRKVVSLPVSLWSYKTEVGVRHMGPMAQDFKRLFGVGPDDRSITTVDADGVALAAIQGLNQTLTEALAVKDVTIAAMQRELAAIKRRLGM